MKRIQADGDAFVFQMGAREKGLLLGVLRLYPLIPSNYARLSKSTEPGLSAECQRLLDEALAEQRQANKKQLQALLEDPHRFEKGSDGFRLILNGSQREGLLQMLNDVRIGSWLILGAPEESERKNLRRNPQSTPYLMAMDLCAFFQAALLGS